MKVAFYATMKPPDDPVPSGDRTMARLLVNAIEQAGHEVELVSHVKCRVRAPEHFGEVAEAAAAEAERVSRRWTAEGVPDVVVAYHVYYKSPDLIGAALARRFDLPYVTIEASHAGKRDRDDWASAQAISIDAIRQAALNVCLTARDREGVARLVADERIAMLAPFIDVQRDIAVARECAPGEPVQLITVAMMLKGNKMESYRLLAAAVKQLKPGGWRLSLVGDGPMRAQVEQMFAGVENVQFHGELDRKNVLDRLAQADVFVWPGWREAFGLAYLEAQACGVPVAAMTSGGVEAVVADGQSGLLSQEGDAAALAVNLQMLIDDAELRRQMGRAAAGIVQQQHSLKVASAVIGGFLKRVTG
jgi:glycosyltransferase involved in cell wall biosynthesis